MVLACDEKSGALRGKEGGGNESSGVKAGRKTQEKMVGESREGTVG